MPTRWSQPLRAACPSAVEFSGPLVAPGTAVLRAKAAGTLLTLKVAEGRRVKAGQVLGRSTWPTWTAAWPSAAPTSPPRVPRWPRPSARRRRTNAWRRSSSSRPTALDNSRAALETARAQLNAALAALDTTRVGLRDATLVAPIAGIVAKRHVLPGEKVSAEQQVLTIVDLSRLELAGIVGTHEVSRLSAGMTVAVQVEGLDEPRGRPHRAHRAGGRARHPVHRRDHRRWPTRRSAARRPVRGGRGRPCPTPERLTLPPAPWAAPRARTMSG